MGDGDDGGDDGGAVDDVDVDERRGEKRPRVANDDVDADAATTTTGATTTTAASSSPSETEVDRRAGGGGAGDYGVAAKVDDEEDEDDDNGEEDDAVRPAAQKKKPRSDDVGPPPSSSSASSVSPAASGDGGSGGTPSKPSDAKTKKKGSKPKRIKKKHMDPKVLEVRSKIQMCCRHNDLRSALESYDDAVENDVRVEPQTFYNLLNLCDGLEPRKVHVGMPKRDVRGSTSKSGGEKAATGEADESGMGKGDSSAEGAKAESTSPPISFEDRRRRAFSIKSRMSSSSIPLNETAYTALVKICCRTGDVDGASQILTEAEGTSQCKPKLRLYSPLLIAHCERGCMKGALEVWARMHRRGKEGTTTGGGGGVDGQGSSIEPTEREYRAMIRCATTTGDAIAMDRVLADLAEDVLVPGRDTTNAVAEWFASHRAASSTRECEEEVSAIREVEDLPPTTAPSLGPVVCPHGWTIDRDCRVDVATGKFLTGCLSTRDDCKLKPVEVSEESWIGMMRMNERIVLEGTLEEHSSPFQGGGKGLKRTPGGGGKKQHRNGSKGATNDDGGRRALERRSRVWTSFKRFLARRIGPPAFDLAGGGSEESETTTTTALKRDADATSSTEADPDDSAAARAASVADASPPATVERKPFDVIIDGANVGYYKQNYAGSPKHVEYRQIDAVVRHFLSLRKSVLLVLHERHFANNLLPNWALPIVRNWDGRRILYRAPGGCNDDWFWMHASLWSGPKTFVVTNDEMRDHHFQMLAARSFGRWKERHRVTFDMFQGGAGELSLVYPEVYSRRLQRVKSDDGTADALVVPLPKIGDERRFEDGTHEAGEGDAPEEETYVCIVVNGGGS